MTCELCGRLADDLLDLWEVNDVRHIVCLWCQETLQRLPTPIMWGTLELLGWKIPPDQAVWRPKST